MMIKHRDLSCESFFNLIFRVKRAVAGRMRGRTLAFFNVFHSGSSKTLYFGSYPRLINSKATQLGNSVAFGLNARIECHNVKAGSALIFIDDFTSFGDYAHIGATTGVSIGKHVLGGSNILITDHSHGSPKLDTTQRTNVPPRRRPIVSKGRIIIGDDVWIGDNAVILSGAIIGRGAIIPAGAIVRGEVEAYTIYGGMKKDD